MDNNKTNKPKDRVSASRTASASGAENRNQENADRREKDKIEENRAEFNGKKGRIETEHTQPTGETSALPGAEENKEVGTAAAGAGLGGNKGTGTNNKKDFS